jgi:hypothetical protein
MKLPREELITFAVYRCIIHFIIKKVGYTNLRGKVGPAALYIRTEGMGQILTNIFGSNCCR